MADMEFDGTVWRVLALGLVIGVQHALEPDHVAAVSSLASGSSSKNTLVRQGTAWAVGHATMLAAIAGPAIVFGLSFDGDIAGWLEFAVGVMLVGLGFHVLRTIMVGRIHFHAHRHEGGTVHFHAHSHTEASSADSKAAHAIGPHEHEHHPMVPWRALIVGLMHGLAGSVALIILAAANAGTASLGLLFVAVFGLGSIAGMVALSCIIAVPLGWTGRHLAGLNTAVRGIVGGVTVMLGIVVIYETLAHDWFV